VGVSQNKQESALWVGRAAHNGCDLAKIFLAAQKSGEDMDSLWDTPEQKEQKAIAAAASGDPQKQFELGCFYYNGTGGKKDLTKAHEWIARAAAQKHARALALLPLLKRQMSAAFTDPSVKLDLFSAPQSN
jgi:TPR repeat protein